MDIFDLSEKAKAHTWRIRFVFFPVDRVKLVDKWIQKDGKYFFRIVFEVKVGLVPKWTAYAHHNDNLLLSCENRP